MDKVWGEYQIVTLLFRDNSENNYRKLIASPYCKWIIYLVFLPSEPSIFP
jgi:hypothetical protein